MYLLDSGYTIPSKASVHWASQLMIQFQPQLSVCMGATRWTMITLTQQYSRVGRIHVMWQCLASQPYLHKTTCCVCVCVCVNIFCLSSYMHGSVAPFSGILKWDGARGGDQEQFAQRGRYYTCTSRYRYVFSFVGTIKSVRPHTETTTLQHTFVCALKIILVLTISSISTKPKQSSSSVTLIGSSNFIFQQVQAAVRPFSLHFHIKGILSTCITSPFPQALLLSSICSLQTEYVYPDWQSNQLPCISCGDWVKIANVVSS